MQNQVVPPPAPSCHSKVELRISCTNLLDKDIMSKSDPLCVLFIQQDGRFYEVWQLASYVMKLSYIIIFSKNQVQ